MNDEFEDMTRRATPAQKKHTSLLWWFSTAIPEIINDCTSDRHRAKIIGAGVLFTWLYASVAWIYFWSINIENPYIFVPLGIFIGYGILTIDRMLIATIAKGKKNFIAIAFRVVLALLLGGFIAQPIILWMFEKDINAEISILHDEKTTEKRNTLATNYQTESTTLVSKQAEIKEELNTRFEAIETTENAFLKEIDGTGGSGKYGIGGIAKEKKEAFERAKEDYASYEAMHNEELLAINERLSTIDTLISKAANDFKANDLNAGFLIRVEALQQLFDKDPTGALKKRYYLILFILVLFELIPIISKLTLPTGSYDEKLRLRDAQEITLATTNSEKEIALYQLYNSKAQEIDATVINQLFTDLEQTKKARIQTILEEWKTTKGMTFDQCWGRIKSEVLSKQEN